jgi:hypothetical protein
MFSRIGTAVEISHLQPKKLFVVWGIWGVLATLILFATMSEDFTFSNTANGLEKIERDGKRYIRVVPSKWLGKSFPLLPYIVANENGVNQDARSQCRSCKENERCESESVGGIGFAKCTN